MAPETPIRTKRTAAGISGSLVCMKAGIARSRLSDIERGYVAPDPDELARILSAIDDLARARKKIIAVAAEAGWPVTAVHLRRTRAWYQGFPPCMRKRTQ